MCLGFVLAAAQREEELEEARRSLMIENPSCYSNVCAGGNKVFCIVSHIDYCQWSAVKKKKKLQHHIFGRY